MGPESGDLAKPKHVGSHLLCLTRILTELPSGWDTDDFPSALAALSAAAKGVLVIADPLKGDFQNEKGKEAFTVKGR